MFGRRSPLIRLSVDVLPLAKEMAGVDMRLESGAIRYVPFFNVLQALNSWIFSELHWHTASEWAYVLKGSVQVTAVDQLGRNFVGTAVRSAI